MADAAPNGHRLTPDQALLVMAAWSRQRLSGALGSMFNGTRDVETLLGYKRVLTYQDYLTRYLRQDIAQRLVRFWPESTWGMPPRIASLPDSETPTPFEQAAEALTKRLRLFTILERADILAQLGHYSVVLVGLRGQSTLQAPAAPVRSPDDIVYLQLYSEEHASIEALETDAAVPTYGKPSLYRLDLGLHDSLHQTTSTARQVLVHASRVIHLPGESMLEDEVYGIPVLQAVYNRLDDLLMVVGGGAYGFWQDAKRRFVLAMREGYTMTPEAAANLTREAEEFDQLKNFMRVQGMDVTQVGGQAASPTAHFTMLIDLLAAHSQIPKRELLGSERGELASTQDDRRVKARTMRRQEKYAGPYAVQPFIDLCLRIGALPAPAQGYEVHWENLLTLSEPEQAGVAKDVATALSTYAGPGMAHTVMTPEQFVEEYLGVEFTGQEPEELALLAPSDEGTDAEETPDEAEPGAADADSEDEA